MNKGINLTLMMGPTVPIPVPQPIIDALTSIEVQKNSDSQSGFQLTFSFFNNSLLNSIIRIIAENGPTLRVVIIVTHRGTPNVLMDGVVTNQQLSPGSNNSGATLTITGKDLSELMNMKEVKGIPYPGMPPSARVLTILSKYAAYGIVPTVIPSVMLDVPIPTDEIPSQNGKDLAYIQSLADEVGYIFYIEPGPLPGASIAYWGPEIKIGLPQPALSVNMDAFTNVNSFSTSIDGSARTLPILNIMNPETKASIPIPIPDLAQLNPTLSGIQPPATNVEFMEQAAKLPPIRAALSALAKVAKKADAVSANGSLSVSRYGHILRSRSLVGVRGAGEAFDGLYFVKSVKHQIKRGEYKQDFSLSRDGLYSTLKALPI